MHCRCCKKSTGKIYKKDFCDNCRCEIIEIDPIYDLDQLCHTCNDLNCSDEDDIFCSEIEPIIRIWKDKKIFSPGRYELLKKFILPYIKTIDDLKTVFWKIL